MKQVFLCLYMGLIMGMLSCSSSEQTSEQAIHEMDTISLWVGTYTDTGSKGIYCLQFNTKTGKMWDLKLMASAVNPSYLAFSKDHQYLFCVNESDSGTVSSFYWDQEHDTLKLVSQVSSQGAYPCYISLHPNEDKIAIGNYMTGNLVSYSVEKGNITDIPQVIQHGGKGVDEQRQEGPHAHCTVFSKSGDYLFVVDLGIDAIKSYAIGEKGISTEGKEAIHMNPGDGPRHLVFHPQKELAFVVNELSSTVVSMSYNSSSGSFELLDRKGTLPEGYDGPNHCADIHVSADGQFLYVSNRGHNSIALFRIGDQGELIGLGHQLVLGDWPRNFTLSPDERFLLVANQRSNNVVVFYRDLQTGLLEPAGESKALLQPVCLKF